jgi:hypothetical protein
MHSYYFYLTLSSAYTIEGYQKTTLRTMTPDEARAINLRVDEHSVPCMYARTKGEISSRSIPVVFLSPRLPKMKAQGIVVKDPGRVTVKDPERKLWSLELDGSEIVGREFKFTRRDFADRNNTSAGRTIASLQVEKAFGEVPVDKFVRVPVDCFCGFDLVSR